ncbi:MAG: putative CRISPR-associated protein [Desulforegulaceae bacterium]|nr:putative CRISPR-associated protein [Desulforegulaceae bacterium]
MNKLILLSTTGTSLFKSNLEPLAKGTKTTELSNEKEITAAFVSNNFKKLASELLKLEGTDRICGAEINTITEIINSKIIEPEHLVFLVSDTDDGKNTGIVLSEYFSKLKNTNLRKTEFKIINGLQTNDPLVFQTKGLANLVTEIGKYIRNFGSENIAIDATGGYKAQIAIAVVIGQALNIPVFYKHEFFNKIIKFPPMPVSLDYSLIGDYASIFRSLEDGNLVYLEDDEIIDDKLKVFLEEEKIEGKRTIALSPIGNVFLTAFRILNPQKPIGLKDSNFRKSPSFGNDHHYPGGFKKFVQKVWEENLWISQIISQDYSQQKGLKKNGFFLKDNGKNHEIIGIYTGSFNVCFKLITENNSKIDLTWAADKLNTKYF